MGILCSTILLCGLLCASTLPWSYCCLVKQSGTNFVEQNVNLLGKAAYESTQLLSLTDVLSLLTNHIWTNLHIRNSCSRKAGKSRSLSQPSRESWPTDHCVSDPHQRPSPPPAPRLPCSHLLQSSKLIAPQASSFSFLVSWYESQSTKPGAEKNDFP